MARKKLIRTQDFPYHITGRANNRDYFVQDLHDLWTLFISTLCRVEDRYGCRVQAFVMMSNHYHLLIETPNGNIDQAICYFHSEVARRSNKATGRINHLFGRRYGWTVMYHDTYFANSLKYIYRNPVRAGMCKDVREYWFSSLNRTDFKWKFDHAKLDIAWLNEPPKKELEEAIGKALRRREFKLARATKSGVSLQLEAPRWKKVAGTF